MTHHHPTRPTRRLLDRPRRARAMTLIELAATTASITALSGLLIPALTGARGQAKETHCLSNLARLAEASSIYATTDANELAIPVHRLMGLTPGANGEYEWGGKAGIAEPLSGTDPLSSKWGTQNGRGPASRLLNRVIYGNVFPDWIDHPGPDGADWLNDSRLELDVFRCPADYGYTGHHFQAWRDSGLTSYDHYGNSYVANAFWVGVAGGNCTIMSNSSFLRPVSRIPTPAQTLLFLENAGRFAWRKNYGSDGCSSLGGGAPGGDVEQSVRGWHGRMWMFQVAFVDGRAGAVRMEGHEHPQYTIGRYPDYNGNPTDWFNWLCVIIRGADWRLDTLPAPPVKTGIECIQAGTLIQPIL